MVFIGIDIHIHLEIYYEQSGEWRHKKELSISRDYYLFAILANVRNQWHVDVIADQRGLPDDVSEKTREFSDSFGSDGHSHTTIYLSEILDFDWNNVMAENKWTLNIAQYKKHLDNPEIDLEKFGRVPAWKSNSQAHVTNLEMEEKINHPDGPLIIELNPNSIVTTLTKFHKLDINQFREFTALYNNIIKEYPKSNANYMRFVMWFDN